MSSVSPSITELNQPRPPKHLLVVCNPASGKGDLPWQEPWPKRIGEWLKKSDWSGELSWVNPDQSTHAVTAHGSEQRPDPVVAIMEAMVQGVRASVPVDAVVAVGGDGTVRNVVQAGVNVGWWTPAAGEGQGSASPRMAPALGVVPTGTGNLLAKNMGLTGDWQEAMKVIIAGHHRTIDVGQMNERVFVVNAGIGACADMMLAADPTMKRTLGVFAYFWEAIKLVKRIRSRRMSITIDGKELEPVDGVGVLVTNASQDLGWSITLSPNEQPDDGKLDICLMALRHRGHYRRLIHQLLLRELGDEPDVLQCLQGKEVILNAMPPMPAQVDGDPLGFTPVTITVAQKVLPVLVAKK